MARTFICLIRHGQTDWNKEFKIQGRCDILLNDYGKKQISLSANKIKSLNLEFDVILSSPLSRAVASANIIKEKLGYAQQIIIRPNLTEREFGSSDGLKISDDVYQKILNDEYLGMETSKQIQTRAISEILDIAQKYPNKNVLICTHSHFIKGIFTVLDPSKTFKSTLLNGSLNFITIEDGKIIEAKFNQ